MEAAKPQHTQEEPPFFVRTRGNKREIVRAADNEVMAIFFADAMDLDVYAWLDFYSNPAWQVKDKSYLSAENKEAEKARLQKISSRTFTNKEFWHF